MTGADTVDLRYATVSDGARIAYCLDGPHGAPVIMFSNSIGTTHRLWDAQAQLLGDRFRVLRYDTRGHGASDAPAGPYVLERLGTDVLDLLRDAGVPRATFCGLSLGGLTAQWLLRNAPQVLRGAVLANTAVRFAPRTLWETRIEAVSRDGMKAISSTALLRWFTPEFAAAHVETIARFRAEFEAIEPRGYAGCCVVLRDADTMPEVTIGTPVVVIVGNRDEATPPVAGEEVAASLPGSRIERLDAAHLSNVQVPEAFANIVAGIALEATES